MSWASGCVWDLGRDSFWSLSRCFIDSQLPGSKSQFLPRTQDEKLRVLIDAFRFHNQDGGEVGLRSLRLPAAVQL